MNKKKLLLILLSVILFMILINKVNQTFRLKQIGGLIIYTNGSKIYTFEPSSLKRKTIYALSKLEINKLGDISGISFSPNGKEIVFSKKEGILNHYSLFVIDLNSDIINKFYMNDVSMLFPSWSPDGKKIAFIAQGDEKQGLYIINVKDSSIHRVSDLHPSLMLPTWSLDSKLLSFTVSKKSEVKPNKPYNIEYKIIIIDTENLSSVELISGLRPQWLSDKEIIYLKDNSFFSINIDNRNSSKIISLPKFSGGVDSLALSRDRQFLIYHTYTPDIGPLLNDGFSIINLKNRSKKYHFGIFSGVVSSLSWFN